MAQVNGNVMLHFPHNDDNNDNDHHDQPIINNKNQPPESSLPFANTHWKANTYYFDSYISFMKQNITPETNFYLSIRRNESNGTESDIIETNDMVKSSIPWF